MGPTSTHLGGGGKIKPKKMKRFRETVSKDNKATNALPDLFLSLAVLAASIGNRVDLYTVL